MKEIIDEVLDLLEENDLDCLVLEEDVAVKTAMAGKHGAWTCNIEVLQMTDTLYALGILSRYIELVQEKRRGVVCVLLNSINYNYVPVGNFEMDMSDGEVTFRTSVAFEDASEISEAVIAHTIYLNWTEIDRFIPAIEAVINGSSPLDALDVLNGEDALHGD